MARAIPWSGMFCSANLERCLDRSCRYPSPPAGHRRHVAWSSWRRRFYRRKRRIGEIRKRRISTWCRRRVAWRLRRPPATLPLVPSRPSCSGATGFEILRQALPTSLLAVSRVSRGYRIDGSPDDFRVCRSALPWQGVALSGEGGSRSCVAARAVDRKLSRWLGALHVVRGLARRSVALSWWSQDLCVVQRAAPHQEPPRPCVLGTANRLWRPSVTGRCRAGPKRRLGCSTEKRCSSTARRFGCAWTLSGVSRCTGRDEAACIRGVDVPPARSVVCRSLRRLIPRVRCYPSRLDPLYG
jgi:hypothetical protein